MANVIIGINGVVLFILLAIAGAIFLGPQFTAANNNGKAAALVQSATQIASAVNLTNTQNGTTYVGNTAVSQLVTDGGLKVVPGNSIVAANAFLRINASTPSSTTLAADTVTADIGAAGQPVCDQIEKQSGGTVALTVADVSALPRVNGCVKLSAVVAPVNGASGEYVVYAKI